MSCSIKIGILILSLLLTGCMVGPNFHSPLAPKTCAYTANCMPKHTASAPVAGGKSQQFVLCQDIPAQWWALYRSEPLNYLICRGIANSPNLQAAQASLRQAQENLRAEIGNLLLPAVDLNAFTERQRFSGSTFGVQNPVTDTATTNIFNLSDVTVNVSYMPDVFGGLRRQVEASKALMDFQYFELEATYLTLTANIVTTAITKASLCAQIQATYELIHAQTEQLKIVQKQFRLGGVSSADVLAQKTQLAQTQATLPPLEKSLAQNTDALAVLVGDLPSESQLPPIDLDCLNLPKDLPLSVPSLLVRQRPDVRASEAQLHQASAQIGVATANLLPQFTLTGSYGAEANRIRDLFSPDAIVWTLMAQVAQPIFHGGALLAQRRAAIAAYCQAYDQYRQTVLQAFQNVADTLQAIAFDADALKAQAAAEKAAHQTLILTRGQFRLGAVSYLSLLNAERQYQQTHISRIQAQATRYVDTAALFQALGGGWWNRGPIPCNCNISLKIGI